MKTAPTFELAASQLPPCARTIASTIASPRPAPPWARERAESARENRSKSRSSPSDGSPGPSSATSIASPPPSERALSVIESEGCVYLTAFSSSASSALRSASASAWRVPGESFPSLQPRGTTDQRMKTSSRKGSTSTSPRTTKSGCFDFASSSSRSRMCSMRSSSSRATSTSGAGFPFSRCRTSRWPRAIVTGVRSSCETSCRKRFWWASRPARSLTSPSRVRTASWRRRACQTIARNMADISGTSKSSPQSCSPLNASLRIRLPVARITRPSTIPVDPGSQTRKP